MQKPAEFKGDIKGNNAEPRYPFINKLISYRHK